MSGELTPAEVEFIAEKQMVSITPKFTQNSVIYLISGNIGPFVSGVPTSVPLWLAIHLRQKLRCDIILPDWLSLASCLGFSGARLTYVQAPGKSRALTDKVNTEFSPQVPNWIVAFGKVWFVETLEEKKAAEAESQYFTKPPHPHYMEMSELLLQFAMDDVPKADELRVLIKDIWDLRVAKFRNSIEQFMTSDSMVARVNNLTVMEINYVRGLLQAALSVRQKLKNNQNLNATLGDSHLFDSRLNESRFSSSSMANDTSDMTA